MANNQLIAPPNPNAKLAQDADGPGRGGGPAPYWHRFFTNVASAINGTTTPSGAAQVQMGNGVSISSGNGSPEGSLQGRIGDLYVNLLGGAGQTLWVKEGGVPGSTSNWAAK